jgi:large subunit ribosomal protein L25
MKVVATTRNTQGSGASRRLRRTGKVPGILYGGNAEPTAIEIEHNPLYHSLRVEAFHSSILDMEIDGRAERVLLRDVQWHAYRQQVMHIDFQRVAADQKIHVKVPLHFVNQDVSPAVKLSAAIVSHVLTEIDVSCLPGNLPEFIEVDLSNLSPSPTASRRCRRRRTRCWSSPPSRAAAPTSPRQRPPRRRRPRRRPHRRRRTTRSRPAAGARAAPPTRSPRPARAGGGFVLRGPQRLVRTTASARLSSPGSSSRPRPGFVKSTVTCPSFTVGSAVTSSVYQPV